MMILQEPETTSSKSSCSQILALESTDYLRRRLFRLLDDTKLRCIVIDCASISHFSFMEVLNQFATSPRLRDSHNLVLAITPNEDWQSSEGPEAVEKFRKLSQENEFDGKIAMLLIQDRESEFDALRHWVQNHGGVLVT